MIFISFAIVFIGFALAHDDSDFVFFSPEYEAFAHETLQTHSFSGCSPSSVREHAVGAFWKSLNNNDQPDLLIAYDSGFQCGSGNANGRYLNFRVFYDAPQRLATCHNHIGCNFQFAASPYTLDFDKASLRSYTASGSTWSLASNSGSRRGFFLDVDGLILYFSAFSATDSYSSSGSATTTHRSRIAIAASTISQFNYRGIPTQSNTNPGWFGLRTFSGQVTQSEAVTAQLFMVDLSYVRGHLEGSLLQVEI
ncbi:hypothetical protein GEMRC1_009347 [Eukaryota sp. GEM-RC1]